MQQLTKHPKCPVGLQLRRRPLAHGCKKEEKRDHTNSWGFMDYEILQREIAATNNLPNADVLAYSDTLGNGQKLSL